MSIRPTVKIHHNNIDNINIFYTYMYYPYKVYKFNIKIKQSRKLIKILAKILIFEFTYV